MGTLSNEKMPDDFIVPYEFQDEIKIDVKIIVFG